MIVLNAAAVVLESVPQLDSRWHLAFRVFEKISMTLLALELLARLWSITERPGFEHPVQGRLRYLLRPLTLIDLLVLATVASPVDLRALLTLRLFQSAARVGTGPVFAPAAGHPHRAGPANRHAGDRGRDDAAAALLCRHHLVLRRTQRPARCVQLDTRRLLVGSRVADHDRLRRHGADSAAGPADRQRHADFGVGIFAIPTAVIIAAVLDADTKEEIEELHRRREQGS